MLADENSKTEQLSNEEILSAAISTLSLNCRLEQSFQYIMEKTCFRSSGHKREPQSGSSVKVWTFSVFINFSRLTVVWSGTQAAVMKFFKDRQENVEVRWGII